MYEFSDKNVREEFKKTEYGKKTNLWLYICLPFFVASITFILLVGFGVIDLTKEQLMFFYPLSMILLVIPCYFDGKRDGAIEQFKRGRKK